MESLQDRNELLLQRCEILVQDEVLANSRNFRKLGCHFLELLCCPTGASNRFRGGKTTDAGVGNPGEKSIGLTSRELTQKFDVFRRVLEFAGRCVLYDEAAADCHDGRKLANDKAVPGQQQRGMCQVQLRESNVPR